MAPGAHAQCNLLYSRISWQKHCGRTSQDMAGTSFESYMSASCRQGKAQKEKIDLDLIERILDANDKNGQVNVKFRGDTPAFPHSNLICPLCMLAVRRVSGRPC